MKVYLKSGKTIKVNRKLGRAIIDFIYNNNKKELYLYDDSDPKGFIRRDEIAAIK